MKKFKGAQTPWEMKHSKISWWIESPKDMSHFASGPIPCYYWHQEQHEFDNCEALANARLIAAAPDLLEALQACADFMDKQCPGGASLVEAADVAIQKALGQ